MTIEDAIKMWVQNHNLKITQIIKIGGWTCRENNPGVHLNLSNNMSITYAADGFVQIAGSISKRSYKAHIGDPNLFPILDRALDEEDKWIRDGYRAP